MTSIPRIAFALAAVVLGARTARADPPAPVPATEPSESKEVVAARAADLAAYEAAKASLATDEAHPWVVIAGGKVVARGASLDDVKAAAKDAVHRFVFRVGEEGDRKEFVTEWYAARFAGTPFMHILGVGFSLATDSVTLTKQGATATFKSTSPFPRIGMKIAAPDGTSPPTPSGKLPEVFLGTVGPEMVLTPDDAVRLHLERWEVPGTLTLAQVPCRRVLVTVAVPGIPGEVTVVGAYPTVPRERMVDLLRWRGHFWSWGVGGPISRMALEGVEDGEWIVFGNDRVLGHGRTPEEAVTAADPETEFAWHRYLMRVPQEMPQPYIPVGGQKDPPHVFDVRKSAKATVSLNGRPMEGRAGKDPEPFWVVSSEDAAPLHLEMAEAPYDARIVDSEDPNAPVRYARAGRAWTDAAEGGRRLVLVVYERAKIPVLDDPIVWPVPDPAGMR